VSQHPESIFFVIGYLFENRRVAVKANNKI